MLIDYQTIKDKLDFYKIKITGALHIGAHDCEELGFYNMLSLSNKDVIWIDALYHKVQQALNKGIPNVYNAVITEDDDKDVMFNVSNNMQSSSVLEFGTHSYEHPFVKYILKIPCKTITLDTFVKRNNIDISQCNLWNLDIQGSELSALKGAKDSLKYAEVLYIEVNEKELYKNCGLIGEVDKYLTKYNFKRVLTSMTEHGWGDALYIKIH